MFRKIRRRAQSVSENTTKDILANGSFGVLAVIGDKEYPYTIPLNYVYMERGVCGSLPNGAIYFHSALQGHKIDAIKSNSKACFCVVEKHDVIPDEFATSFISALAFGSIQIMNDKETKEALYALGDKYNPGAEIAIAAEIAKDGPRCCVLELKIEHLSGKRSLK